MLQVYERCHGLKEADVSDKKQALVRKISTELDCVDRPYTRATINALPDNALLETFEFYLGKDVADQIDYSYDYDGWQTLVHVCYRWRCIVFASPHRLDLKLYCTPRRLVSSSALDIWPTLPTIIYAQGIQSRQQVTTLIASLRQHNRVCKIYYCNGKFQDSLLKEFAAIDEPFPSLTSLKFFSFGKNVPALPDSFLGGSAPRLRSLDLNGIPYPSMGRLLLSTTNLIRLSLRNIPYSGYIAPETIVPSLTMLPRLELLFLGLQYTLSRAYRASRHSPPLTRVTFPNLTSLGFSGNVEYLEDILAQIETPMLNESHFCFFNQPVFDTPLLGHFIRRTEAFRTFHRARLEFFSWAVAATLWGRDEMANNDREALRLQISCEPLDWQLSAIAQVLKSFLSFLPTLESFEIAVSREDWQEEIEVIQWREFLDPFTFVKELILIRKDSVRLVATALQELARERVGEVLPDLQTLILWTYGWRPPGPVKEAIEQFITTRRNCGHPPTIHFWDTKSRTHMQ